MIENCLGYISTLPNVEAVMDPAADIPVIKAVKGFGIEKTFSDVVLERAILQRRYCRTITFIRISSPNTTVCSAPFTTC